MNHSCPLCHQPLQKCPLFAHTNSYLQTHTTKLQCSQHEPAFSFSLFLESASNEIHSFYLYSPKLKLTNVLMEGDYYWRIYDNTNTLAHGEALLSFPQALNLLQRYNNLLPLS